MYPTVHCCISDTHSKDNKQTKDATCLAAVSVPSTSKRHRVLVSTAASPILSEWVAVSVNPDRDNQRKAPLYTETGESCH